MVSSEFLNTSGSLESVTYPTSIPGPSERRMYVYLPEDYKNNADTRYPVLYMLHGARGDESDWIAKACLLPAIDSLTKAGKMSPTIVVFTNMNSFESEEDYAMGRHKGALESFFEVDGAVEASFVKDVVGAVDSLFRTKKDKKSRAIAGISLGGMQAIYISASSPDTFGSIGVFSAPRHSVIKKGPYSSFYNSLDKKLDSQFAQPPFVYKVYVGTKDIYLDTMKKLCKDISSRGFPCSITIMEGGHQWNVWRNFAIDFMEKCCEKRD